MKDEEVKGNRGGMMVGGEAGRRNRERIHS